MNHSPAAGGSKTPDNRQVHQPAPHGASPESTRARPSGRLESGRVCAEETLERAGTGAAGPPESAQRRHRAGAAGLPESAQRRPQAGEGGVRRGNCPSLRRGDPERAGGVHRGSCPSLRRDPEWLPRGRQSLRRGDPRAGGRRPPRELAAGAGGPPARGALLTRAEPGLRDGRRGGGRGGVGGWGGLEKPLERQTPRRQGLGLVHHGITGSRTVPGRHRITMFLPGSGTVGPSALQAFLLDASQIQRSGIT
ncbi:uncharacterized protein [Callorhinus ursinus]|uniref:uncharacterized protein n=1 Tax=Callorhinus ursinus TaxID=34884 RepID=UPI003CD033C8